MSLTRAMSATTILVTGPYWPGGFGSPFGYGAEAMRRKVRGFFYASRVLAGGVWGSREACRFRNPVYQSCTSSAAQSLVASVGGLKTIVTEAVMPNSNVVALRAIPNQSTLDVPPPNAAMPPLLEQVRRVPEFMADVIDLILSDFDYQANMQSNTAIAVRLLALMADRVETALANGETL